MSILITGATGFVGSAFLARLLGSDAIEGREVFALVRRGETDARARLEQALARAMHAINRSDATPQDLAKKVTILEGDLNAELAGLTTQDLATLYAKGTTEIWHVAGELSPGNTDINIAAAHTIANLASRLSVLTVRAVSTAFVTGAGTTECDVLDDPAPATAFNNAYEKSKLAAERVLREAAQVDGWALSILRPTIIVGARDSKLPAGSKSGLYGVIDLLRKQSQHLAKTGETQKVTLYCGDGDLNLVYIDQVVDAMLAEKDVLIPAGKTRTRFVSGTNVPIATVVASLKNRLGLRIRRVTDPIEIPASDRALNRALSFFAPYTFAENRKTFSGETQSEADKIYDVDLLNLVEAGRNEAENGALMDDLRMIRLQRASGGPVVAYINRDFDPDAETAVLVNAYGMPSTVLQPLINKLRGQGMNTVTWDCRGLPDKGFDLAVETGVSVADHFDDWELICATQRIRKMHLLGWSTGAVVASYIAAQAPKRIKTLSLLNGSFMHRKAHLTPFQKNLKSIMPKVAVSPAIAKVLFNSVFKEDRSAMVKLFTRDIARKAEEAMSVTRPSERHLVQLLTTSPDRVFRYARLIRAFVKEDPMAWLSDVRAPTTVFTGNGDITAHPQGSYDASTAIRGSALHVVGGTTHMALYADPEFIAHVVDFVTGTQDVSTTIKKAA